jgi:psiF repeat-containing protein
MKKLSILTAALLITGTAFAATAPSGSAPTATPATQAQPAQKHSAAHCEKQAKEKKLTGDAEKEFVKDCREGKKAN